MILRKENYLKFAICLCLALMFLITSGCGKKNLWPQQTDDQMDETEVENMPYYANDFNDILVPNELRWDREGSMAMRTESFAGGVMRFVGRVEVNSLADFFVNTMAKNKWKMVGSAKYKNVLLAFTKPNKTAMITIFESDLSSKTTVQIYVTDDITARHGYNPFSEDTIR